jgi:hypothetical protein
LAHVGSESPVTIRLSAYSPTLAQGMDFCISGDSKYFIPNESTANERRDAFDLFCFGYILQSNRNFMVQGNFIGQDFDAIPIIFSIL